MCVDMTYLVVNNVSLSDGWCVCFFFLLLYSHHTVSYFIIGSYIKVAEIWMDVDVVVDIVVHIVGHMCDWLKL